MNRKLTEETKKKISKATTGKNNGFYGQKHTEESLKKMSENRKGKCVGEENPFYGKTHDEATRKKISKAVRKANKKRGKIVFSEEQKRRLSEAAKGRKKSKAHVQNWKKVIKKKFGTNSPSCNEEVKEKIRQARLGTKHSEETKKKLKEHQARLKKTYWTPEKRKEYSEMMKERFRKNPEMHPTRILSRNKMSYPEKIVYDYLDGKGIVFEYNKYMAPYFVDFVVDGLGIEIDGEYWHRDRKDYDQERDVIIKEKYGMDIVRFPALRIINEGPNIIDEIIS